MFLKLYAPLGNFRANKILLTGEYADLKIEEHFVDMKTIKEKDFLKKNPLGKIPVLETNEGCIFESGAITRFLARVNKEKKLYGDNNFEEGLVDQWVDFSCLELEPAVLQIIFPIQGWIQYCKDKHARALHDVKTCLHLLDAHLADKKFMVGKNITIADISLVSVLMNLYRFVFVEKDRKQYANVTEWLRFFLNEKKFIKVWGNVRLCEKEFPVPIHHWQEKNQKTQKKDDEKKAKEKAEKAASKKKAAEPTKKKEKEEEEEAPKKKDKNPLDLLPPTTFNLFDFKTLFVNAPNKKEATDFFWNNYDAEGFSLWHVKYDKAEGEGKVLFMTSNLMNGFLQRLESFRKYSFGVHGVYGDEPNLEIQGVWVWRGKGHPEEIKEHPSYEYHQWIELGTKPLLIIKIQRILITGN